MFMSIDTSRYCIVSESEFDYQRALYNKVLTVVYHSLQCLQQKPEQIFLCSQAGKLKISPISNVCSAFLQINECRQYKSDKNPRRRIPSPARSETCQPQLKTGYSFYTIIP